jgi:hypothetical protein
MPPTTIGPYDIAGVQMPTWILPYNDGGVCESPQSRALLLEALRTGDHTDVFLFSHGWNNNFGQAISLYGNFLKQLEAHVQAKPPARPFKPLFAGITWPSEWLDFSDSPTIAGDTSGDEGQNDTANEMAARIEAATPGKGIRFRELVAKPSVTREEAIELATLVKPLLSSSTQDEIVDENQAVTAGDIVLAIQSDAAARQPAVAVDLDDYGSVDGGGATIADPQAAGWPGFLDPRGIVRLFSVYQMKDRAGRVGTRGMGPLLRDVLGATRAKVDAAGHSSTQAKVHVAGHSYGCKVMLSAICAPDELTRPVDSLLLLQPAVSYLSLSAKVPGTTRAGGYRAALDPKRVVPPILSTYSRKDFPLHRTFHLSLRRESDLGEAQIAGAGDPPSKYAALGGYGPRGAGERLIDLPRSGDDYTLNAARVIGLDGSANLINSHGDVHSPHTAWAMYQLAFGPR